MTTSDKMLEKWNELVAAGIAVVGKHNWELGDLALEVETGYGEGALEKYAAEIGVSYQSLKVYRWVAAQWPLVTRVTNRPWTVHRDLARLSNRRELIEEVTTAAEARQAVRDSSGQQAREEAKLDLDEETRQFITDELNLVVTFATRESREQAAEGILQIPGVVNVRYSA